MLFIFSTPVSIRHLWQLKTVVFLHRSLIGVVLFLSELRLHPLYESSLKNHYLESIHDI